MAAGLKLLLFALLVTQGLGKKKKQGVKIVTESRPSDCSVEAAKGDTLVVHYTGALESGQVFDTSKTEGREPFSVTLGAGQVIPGWEEGLTGMCVGEERKLIIPPSLGYGERGVEGIIPPNSVLIFSVELLDLQKPSLISVPSGSGLYTVVGVVLILGLIGYELYRRASSEGADGRTKKGGSNKRKRR